MKMLAAILVAVATITAAGAQQSSTPARAQPQVTFTKDVAPILQRNCQQCHRPGSIAPMSLLTYQDATAVGAVDQAEGRRARDAAVAHRSHTSGSRSSRTIRR